MSPPNILFILTDDQGSWALGAAGNPEIITPNLDRLAASGIRFENFFCASPVCSPARASLLTGRIPSQHGIHDWIRRGSIDARPAAKEGKLQSAHDDIGIEYLEGMLAYTEVLAENGYTCGLSGKWHLGDSMRPQKGFSFWHVIPYGGSNYFNASMIIDGEIVPTQGYLTDVITDHAIQFLEEQQTRPGPFYLSVNYNAPHSPWDAGEHPAELTDLYKDCPFDTCPELPLHPNQINSVPRGTGERRRELLTGYYAAITGIDRSVGRLVDWLEAHGLTQDTLVIFTGDNGMNMGHHGLWGKGNATFPQNLYDSSVKVPVIFSQPGALPQGVVKEDLLSHYDVMPTLLDYLGLPNPAAGDLPGQSFAPLLSEQALAGRKEVVVFDEYGPNRMIRSRDWKYIHRYPYGPNELYDLQNDPGETRNLIQDEGTIEIAASETAAVMKARLDAWFARYADPRLDGTREPVYGKGQLDRAGVYSQGRPVHCTDWYFVDEEGRRREPSA